MLHVQNALYTKAFHSDSLHQTNRHTLSHWWWWSCSRFRVLFKDTSACGQEELGTEPPTLWLPPLPEPRLPRTHCPPPDLSIQMWVLLVWRNIPVKMSRFTIKSSPPVSLKGDSTVCSITLLIAAVNPQLQRCGEVITQHRSRVFNYVEFGKCWTNRSSADNWIMLLD